MSITTAQAAARLEVPEHEVISVKETDQGVVYRMFDGTTLIEVPDETPDADGKTGLMFRVAPCNPYRGGFPVYTEQE